MRRVVPPRDFLDIDVTLDSLVREIDPGSVWDDVDEGALEHGDIVKLRVLEDRAKRSNESARPGGGSQRLPERHIHSIGRGACLRSRWRLRARGSGKGERC